MQRRMLAAAGVAAVGLAITSAPAGAALAPTATASAAKGKRSYVVLYEKGVSHATARRAIRRAGGKIVKENRAIGLATVVGSAKGFEGRARKQGAIAGISANRSIGRAGDRLARSRKIERGVGEGIKAAAAAPTVVAGDPLAGLQWDMKMIDATPEGSYAVQQGSHDVLVGDIDTGIDATHPDLAANFDRVLSRNFTVDDERIDGLCADDPDGSCIDPPDVDEDSHGTHTAGTIAAAANGRGITGVAPGVGIVNLRAGQDSGYFFLQPTVDAITYAAQRGIDVVNMSFYTDPWLYNCRDNAADTAEEQLEQATVIDATQRAVDYARAHGVTLISALGNENTDLGNPVEDATSPDYPGGTEKLRTIDNTCLSMPTEADGVIGVSALGPSGRKAWYSNYGIEQTDFSAPGGDLRDYSGTDQYLASSNAVLSSYPAAVAQAQGELDADGNPTTPSVVREGDAYYAYFQGTSMAAPHAAGVAALIVAQYGRPDRRHGGLTLRPDRVERILTRSALQHDCPAQNPFVYSDPNSVLGEVPPARCDGDISRNGFYGAGVVNALRAIASR